MNTHCLMIFCTDKSDWISTIIRWITWDRFSHVALVSPDMRWVVEATHGMPVRVVLFDEMMRRDGSELRMVRHPDPDEVWLRALSQVGKPYDEAYIYGWLMRNRYWQDPEKWACAELVAWAGNWFDASMQSSISPRDLHLISQEYDPAVYEVPV